MAFNKNNFCKKNENIDTFDNAINYDIDIIYFWITKDIDIERKMSVELYDDAKFFDDTPLEMTYNDCPMECDMRDDEIVLEYHYVLHLYTFKTPSSEERERIN